MNWICLVAMGLVYCIEPLLWLHSMESANHIHKRVEVSVIAFLGYYILTLIKQYSVFRGNGQAMHLLMTILLLLYIAGATWLLFPNTLQRKMLFLGVFFICNLSTELISVTGAMLFWQKSLGEIAEYGLCNILCTLESKILLGVLCYVLFFTKEERSLERVFCNSDLLPLTLFAVLFEIPFSVVFRFSDKIFDRAVDLCLFLLIQVYIVALTAYVIHIAYKYQADFDELQHELKKKENIDRMSSKLTQLRHDMSFYTSMILHFVQKQQYAELREFVGVMAGEMCEADDIFLLEDQMVASTLDIIAQQMREKAIKFEHVIMITDFRIPSNDISRLLFNLLRNAMEAAEKLEEGNRKVTLEIGRKFSGYHINCMNTYYKSKAIKKELFTSSKADKRLHGKGLAIIKQIVERNGGIIKIYLHDSLFEIDCYIPYKEVGM